MDLRILQLLRLLAFHGLDAGLINNWIRGDDDGVCMSETQETWEYFLHFELTQKPWVCFLHNWKLVIWAEHIINHGWQFFMCSQQWSQRSHLLDCPRWFWCKMSALNKNLTWICLLKKELQTNTLKIETYVVILEAHVLDHFHLFFFCGMPKKP